MKEREKERDYMDRMRDPRRYFFNAPPPCFAVLYLFPDLFLIYITTLLLSSLMSSFLLMSKSLNLSATVEERVRQKTKNMGGRDGGIWRVNACRIKSPVIFPVVLAATQAFS